METTNNIYYIYKHTFKNNTIYIGKGKNKRAFSMDRKKSPYWWNVFLKHGTPTVEILLKNLSEQNAFIEEINIISDYKLKGFKLCNMTNGGEGQSGAIVSDETRKKLSNKLKGDKHPMYGKHHSLKVRKKMSDARVGRFKGENCPSFGKKRTDENKKKISNSRKGKCVGTEHHLYGKHHSDETKERISKSKQGQRLGIPRTKETKRKINMANNINNKSGKTGVSFDKSRNKWASNIKVDGVLYRLGRFDKIEDAINARIDAENKYLI